MPHRTDGERLRHLIGPGERVVAVAPATPDGALPDTVAAVVARSFGRGRAKTDTPTWDPDVGGFVAYEPPIDLRRRRQVLLVVTAGPDRLVITGVDVFGRPTTVLWSTDIAVTGCVRIEPARLHGIATEALVIQVPAAAPLRFVLARPHRAAARELAAHLDAAVRYSDG